LLPEARRSSRIVSVVTGVGADGGWPRCPMMAVVKLVALRLVPVLTHMRSRRGNVSVWDPPPLALDALPPAGAVPTFCAAARFRQG
jgi:hypothetical protein